MEQLIIKRQSRLNYKVDEPPMYDVYINNDDVTTFEFVIMVLCVVFFKTEDEAKAIADETHNKGRAFVGTYSFDIANSKVNKVVTLARSNGFPLTMSVVKK